MQLKTTAWHQLISVRPTNEEIIQKQKINSLMVHGKSWTSVHEYLSDGKIRHL